MGTKEQRIELLKGMNQYIIDLGDEEVYETWFSLGVPDEPTEDDYEFIVENKGCWREICELFGNLIRIYDRQRAEALYFYLAARGRAQLSSERRKTIIPYR